MSIYGSPENDPIPPSNHHEYVVLQTLLSGWKHGYERLPKRVPPEGNFARVYNKGFDAGKKARQAEEDRYEARQKEQEED